MSVLGSPPVQTGDDAEFYVYTQCVQSDSVTAHVPPVSKRWNNIKQRTAKIKNLGGRGAEVCKKLDLSSSLQSKVNKPAQTPEAPNAGCHIAIWRDSVQGHKLCVRTGMKTDMSSGGFQKGSRLGVTKPRFT